MKPTGFEEYFADAPVTPAIYVEEQSLYDRYDSRFADSLGTLLTTVHQQHLF